LHVELKECSRQLLLLPGRGRLARAQVDDRIARPDGLARLHPEIVDNAVALVEEADDRHPVLHRRQPGLVALEHLTGIRGLELLLASARFLAARGKRDRQRDCKGRQKAHCYSGVQGW
jgi:hypothetical protein